MNLLKTTVDIIKNALLINRLPDHQFDRANLQRIILMFYILMPLHLVLIAIFALALKSSLPETDLTTYYWRLYIIYAHSVMIVLLTAGGITALQLRKSNNKYNIAGLTLSHLFAFLYLILGAVTCVIDQLVTSSINPFLIANVAVALFVIMRPLFSLFIYTLSYLIFFFLLPLTQHSSELISTVRVNGLSASAVGLGLALVMWRTNALSALQKQLIQAQNEELEKKNRQLKHLARTDMMTGLYNRTRFTEFVEMEVERLKRTGETSSLIILDLDDFKNVNDLYGHPNGDTVLKLVAGVIKGQLRSTDILCRFGGEEFAVLLPGTAPEGALNVAEKIRGAIEGCSFTGKLESLKITASLGLATLGTNGATSFDTAYQKADQALYNAKGKGRNRIEFSA